MDRLYHSYLGYLRSMQLSSTAFFVFVEGIHSDPYFYSGIWESIPNHPISYEIRAAKDLPGDTGGKNALISFFGFLRRRGALCSSVAGKRTTSIFFVDKDIDDLLGKKKRSQHVVYTEHYDIQNYFFMYGDLLRGAASAASLNPSRLRAELGDAPGWCQRAASLWKEWISLCLCMLENNISCEANFGVMSRIQTRPEGAHGYKQI